MESLHLSWLAHSLDEMGRALTPETGSEVLCSRPVGLLGLVRWAACIGVGMLWVFWTAVSITFSACVSGCPEGYAIEL